MPKQSIAQRIVRVHADWKAGKPIDIRARWKKIKEDLPEEAAAIEAKFGPIPEATLDDVPLESAIQYAGRDADATARLDPHLDRMLDSMGLREVYEIDLAIIPMVDRMQHVGFRISPDHFRNLGRYLTDLMAIKVGEIRNESFRAGYKTGPDFNPNSPKQVRELMAGLGIRTGKTTKVSKEQSTNDKVLESLAFKYPTFRLVADYRELAKLRDSFCEQLPKYADESLRIHPNFRVTRVSSGRLSCTDPNLLAIPVRTELGKLIRSGFVAGEGRVLGSWDLDQIEMREMAHQSQDPVMIGWFNDGLDVHRMTGAAAFGCRPEDVTTVQRYASKRLGFGIITGITEIGLAEQMALAGAEGWDEATCGKFIAEYFQILRGVGRFIGDCRAEARRHSYVRDRWGRIRYLPGVHSELPFVREEALRQSHSFKISASAQGTLKRSMKCIWDWWKSDGIIGQIEPLLQIHDELVTELDAAKDFVEYIDAGMVHFLCHTPGNEMRVPIKAKGSTAPDWGSLKD